VTRGHSSPAWRVDGVAVVSGDLQRSRRFYSEVLGLPPFVDRSDLLVFDTGPARLAIHATGRQGSGLFAPERAGVDHLCLSRGDRAAPPLDVKDPDGVCWSLGAASPALAAVESYLDAFRNRQVSDIRLAPSVTYESPLAGHLAGVEAVVDFLGRLASVVNGVRVLRHVVQDDCVASRLEFQTPAGLLCSLDLFEVAHGLIQHVQAFHDPRPHLGVLPSFDNRKGERQ
jgi:catechol 2,3-dioxygenase-like lactoylglutathione lyase family enzyme